MPFTGRGRAENRSNYSRRSAAAVQCSGGLCPGRFRDVVVEHEPRDATRGREADEALESAVAEARLADDDVRGVLARAVVDPIVHAETLRLFADRFQLL